MKKYTLLLIGLIIVSSCYTYKAYEPELDANGAVVTNKSNANLAISKRVSRTSPSVVNTNDAIFQNDDDDVEVVTKPKEIPVVKESKSVTVTATVDPNNIKPRDIIVEKEYYQFDAFDKTYKMEAGKWKGDTIYGNVKGNPKKELKFHEKDIQNLKVRKFSKGRSDALTIAAYSSVAFGIILLLK